MADLSPPTRGRILVVENEIAIALEIEACLRDAGFDTLGPALDAGEAADYVAKAGFDAAVIDLGLVSSELERVMRPLVDHQIPYLFMSGYSELTLPAWVPMAERFIKPFALADLVDRLQATLAARLPS